MSGTEAHRSVGGAHRPMHLEQLPDELVLHIVRFLSERDWCALMRVSRHLFRLANDSALWNRRVTRLTEGAASPPPRVCHASWMHKGRLFVYGGHNPVPGSNFISDVKGECIYYDFVGLAKNAWQLINGTEPLPTRTEHSATVFENKAYVLGGYAGVGGYKMDAFYLDLNVSANQQVPVIQLETRGEQPNSRSAHSCVLWKHFLYIFGGWDGLDTNDDFYKLDLGMKPGPRRSHTAVTFKDSMYLFGGFNGNDNCAPHIHRFDFVTKRWEIEEPKSSLTPQGRSRSRAVVYGNKIAIFGGWDRVTHFEDWWEFDLNSRTWQSIQVAFPLGALGQYSVDVVLNQAYIFGGYTASVQSSSSAFWSYSLGHLGRLSGEA